MLGMKLVHLIETHSDALSRGLAAEIRAAERTSDFHDIPAHELQVAAIELYRHLGEWLLQKTERDIASRFNAIAARRAAQGIRLHQFVWALILTREHLWHFLRRVPMPDTIFEWCMERELTHRLYELFIV